MMWKIFLDSHSYLEHVLPKKITSFLYLTASLDLQKKRKKKGTNCSTVFTRV